MSDTPEGTPAPGAPAPPGTPPPVTPPPPPGPPPTAAFPAPGGHPYAQPGAPAYPGAAPPKRRSGKKIAAFVTAGVLALGLAGAGAAYALLRGGGPQPEDVLPANAIAFTKVDLDPGAGQKVSLYQLSRKFPDLAAKARSEESAIEDVVLGSLFEGGVFGLSYDEVEPWLGKRAALGVFPARTSTNPLDFALVLAVTDRDKAKATLDGMDGEMGYAFAGDDFVIVSDTTATAKSIVTEGEKKSLADADAFGKDVDSLEGGQVAVAWADLGQVLEVVRKEAGDTPELEALAGTNVKGRVVMGLHAESDYLELQANAFDTGETTASLPAAGKGDLLDRVPSDVVVAASVTGLGPALARSYSAMADAMGSDPSSPLAALEQLGLELPGDLVTILGNETAVVVDGATEPAVGVVTRNDDPQKALDAVSPLAELLGSNGVRVERTERGLVAGNNDEMLAELKAGKGGLRESDRFRKVVENPGGAVVAYVDLAKLVDANMKGTPEYGNVKAFDAAGLSVRGGKDQSLRLRVSFR
jgi:hypothetical protein